MLITIGTIILMIPLIAALDTYDELRRRRTALSASVASKYPQEDPKRPQAGRQGAIADMRPAAPVRDADIRPSNIFSLCRVLDGKPGTQRPALELLAQPRRPRGPRRRFRMSEASIAHVFGLALCGLFATVLFLNALAY